MTAEVVIRAPYRGTTCVLWRLALWVIRLLPYHHACHCGKSGDGTFDVAYRGNLTTLDVTTCDTVTVSRAFAVHSGCWETSLRRTEVTWRVGIGIDDACVRYRDRPVKTMVTWRRGADDDGHYSLLFLSPFLVACPCLYLHWCPFVPLKCINWCVQKTTFGDIN